jgi:hypothetical protein
LNAFTDDEVKLKLFSRTLTNKAHAWYKSCPAGMFDTWKKLSVVFLSCLYLESKSFGARRMITNFQNRLDVSLVNDYVRFRGLLNHCPHHELPPWLVLHTF